MYQKVGLFSGDRIKMTESGFWADDPNPDLELSTLLKKIMNIVYGENKTGLRPFLIGYLATLYTIIKHFSYNHFLFMVGGIGFS